MADPEQAFEGGSPSGGIQKCLHLLKYRGFSATIVVFHTNEFILICRSKSGNFFLIELWDFSGNSSQFQNTLYH